LKSRKIPLDCRKALLPLKKGGREGILARPFQRAKVLPELFPLGVGMGEADEFVVFEPSIDPKILSPFCSKIS
jgi:hypothetical protein